VAAAVNRNPKASPSQKVLTQRMIRRKRNAKRSRRRTKRRRSTRNRNHRKRMMKRIRKSSQRNRNQTLQQKKNPKKRSPRRNQSAERLLPLQSSWEARSSEEGVLHGIRLWRVEETLVVITIQKEVEGIGTEENATVVIKTGTETEIAKDDSGKSVIATTIETGETGTEREVAAEAGVTVVLAAEIDDEELAAGIDEAAAAAAVLPDAASLVHHGETKTEMKAANHERKKIIPKSRDAAEAEAEASHQRRR